MVSTQLRGPSVLIAKLLINTIGKRCKQIPEMDALS
jgi:hypothetical protein